MSHLVSGKVVEINPEVNIRSPFAYKNQRRELLWNEKKRHPTPKRCFSIQRYTWHAEDSTYRRNQRNTACRQSDSWGLFLYADAHADALRCKSSASGPLRPACKSGQC